jgi:hypothetical protein
VEIEKDKMQGFFDRLVCQIPLNQRSTWEIVIQGMENK